MSPSIPPSIPCVVLTAVLLSLPPNRVCKGLTFSRTTTRLQETGRTATAATATASRPCPGIQTGQRATTTAKTSPILTLTLTHNNAAAGAVLYVVQQRLWSWVRASEHRSDRTQGEHPPHPGLTVLDAGDGELVSGQLRFSLTLIQILYTLSLSLSLSKKQIEREQWWVGGEGCRCKSMIHITSSPP